MEDTNHSTQNNQSTSKPKNKKTILIWIKRAPPHNQSQAASVTTLPSAFDMPQFITVLHHSAAKDDPAIVIPCHSANRLHARQGTE